MSKYEAEALLVLPPGVFIRHGVHCPNCHRQMRAESQWRVKASVMEWTYVCGSCGTVLDANLRIVRSFQVYQLH
jgi:transcription elongation factor Elf1